MENSKLKQETREMIKDQGLLKLNEEIVTIKYEKKKKLYWRSVSIFAVNHDKQVKHIEILSKQLDLSRKTLQSYE